MKYPLKGKGMVLTLSVFIIFIGGLLAQEPAQKPSEPEGLPMPPMGMMGLPNLSDEQKEQIQALRIKHLKEVMPIETDIKIKELELAGLWQRDKLDTKAIVAKVKEIADLRTKLELANVNHKIEIYKILTPEQRKRFIEGIGPGKGMRQRLQKRFRQMYRHHLGPMEPDCCPHR